MMMKLKKMMTKMQMNIINKKYVIYNLYLYLYILINLSLIITKNINLNKIIKSHI